MTLRSFLAGRWIEPGDKRTVLLNPATEEPLAEAGTPQVDFGEALAYARDRGGPALRELSFAQRAELIRAVSKLIHSHRDELIEIAINNGGNTRGDAKRRWGIASTTTDTL